MKILSVKFLNLNSLKGEHEIRFNEAPFTEIGLFAITGPTGAGKTTILDAITVALYGKVHRHDNSDVKDIMSRHTAECYAEVEFEVNLKAYRAKWSLKRSRGDVDGKIQPEKMELAEVETGKLLGGHTTGSIKQEIKDLCGLDYNQFVRSVILCQGDFTMFLKANPNERSELLEKVTDTGIYTEISVFVYEKQKEEKGKLDNLQIQLDGVDLLSEEERADYHKNLISQNEEEKLLKDKQAGLTEKINWLKTVAKLEGERVIWDKELSEKRQLQQDNRTDFERLRQHQKAISFKPSLVEIEGIAAQVKNINVALIEQQQLLPRYTSTVQTGKETLDLANVAVSKAEQELAVTEPVLEQVLMLDNNIKHTTEQVQRYQSRLQQLQKNVQDLDAEKKLKSASLDEMVVRTEALNNFLTANKNDASLGQQLPVLQQQQKALADSISKIDAAIKEKEDTQGRIRTGSSLLKEVEENIGKYNREIAEKETLLDARQLAALEQEANLLPAEINILGSQQRIALSYKTNSDQQAVLAKSLQELENEYDSYTLAHQQLSADKTAAEIQLNDLRQLVVLEQRMQKYEADRAQLQPEQPCPLCGSVHHPYADGHYTNKLSEAEQRRNKQEEVVTALQDQHGKSNLYLNTLQVKIESQKNELGKINAALLDLAKEFDNNNAHLSANVVINEPFSDIIQLKQNHLSTLQQQIQQTRAAQETVATLKQSLAIEQGKLNSFNERINVLTESLEKIELTLSQVENSKEELKVGINNLLVAYGVAADQPDVIEILTDRWKKFEDTQKELQQLQLEHVKVETALANTGRSLEEKLTEQTEREKEFVSEQEQLKTLRDNRISLFGDKDPGLERERLNKLVKESRIERDRQQQILQKAQEQLHLTEDKISRFTKDLETNSQTLQQLTDKLLVLLKKEGLDNIAALQALFLQEEESEKIATLEKSIESRISVLLELLLKNEKTRQEETGKKLTDETLEMLAPQLESANTAVATLHQEIGRLRQILEKDDELKRRSADISAQIALQKTEFSRWQQLSNLIGSADGKKFRRFAQGLTLSRLTELANRHLMKFSDRYTILKSKDDDLELLIIDGYQADAVRPMATLSGGESFLVSLALALGLSDLASHKVQINSLFIDEGFGTLDADTLDIAISALENLQANGKTIGIISHVEALKERITTQVQLSKRAGGWSDIKVIARAAQVVL